MNTGTPRREKPSAITSSETVLPVPVAPATEPWRFPYLGSRWTGRPPLPIRMSSTRASVPGAGSGLALARRPHLAAARLVGLDGFLEVRVLAAREEADLVERRQVLLGLGDVAEHEVGLADVLVGALVL